MIQFTEEDAQTCFACNVQKPVFRIASLERVPSKDGFLIPACAATLLCRRCLKIAFSELHQSFTQCQIPLGNNETENHSLVRQVGVLVTPISITRREWQLLLEQFGTDGSECVADTKSAENCRDGTVSLPLN